MRGLVSVAASLLSISSLVTADPIVERQAVTETLAFTQPSQTCVAGAHMIIARASTEPQGEGIMETVASAVMDMVPSSDAVAVVYPATIDHYPTSEQEGVVGMKQLVTDYVSNCPGHWIILMGYSQGAQVVGDTLIGSNNSHFSDRSTNPTGLGKEYLAQIAGLIQMGDPGFTPDTPGKQGNATKSGVFARLNTAAYSQYGFQDKMQTYCNAGDVYCASGTGTDGVAIHLGYIDQFGKAAASFAAKAFTSANGGPVQGAATGGGSSAPATKVATTGGSGGSATSYPATSAAGGSAAKPTTTGSMAAQPFLTSQRFMPVTTTFTGRFTQLAQPAAPTAGAAAPGASVDNRGVAAAVFGGAMFAMGMI